MCDPVTIGALALSAAGSGINAYETNKTQGKMIAARNEATTRELGRQHEFQAKSGETFKKSVDQFMPEQQETALTQAQTRATDQFNANAPVSVGGISSGNGPQIVKDTENKTIADAFSKIGNQNAAFGKLAGWDQRAFDNNVGLNANGRDLNINSDLARTSAGVNRLEQDAATRNAFKPNSGIGDLLKFAGSVGAYSGGQGKTFGDLFGGLKAGTPWAAPTAPQGVGIWPV